MSKLNESIQAQIKQNWDSIAKPLDSMGKFEALIAKIGAVQNSVYPTLAKPAVVVLCSDNGIVEEGVSQSGQEVTATCAQNIALGKSSVGVMAAGLGADVFTVDLGIASKEKIDKVIDKKIREGTRNFLKAPAMTEAELNKALEIGSDLARSLKNSGYDVICIGEMGIGNTTTCAAVAASVLGLPADSCTGRGAGLSDAGFKRKKQVINAAIHKYGLYTADVKKILQCVGGYDIAGMAGVFIGAKVCGIPVILDGIVSVVAALVCTRLYAGIEDVLIPSHKSREPVVQRVFEELKLLPVIEADMALGEGSGAVMMLGLLRSALCVYDKALRFGDSGVEQYTRK